MTAALEGGEWSVARPGHTLPPAKTRYPFYRRLGGPQHRSGLAEHLVPTGIRSRTVQPVVSRYTDWATRPTFKHLIHQLNARNMEHIKMKLRKSENVIKLQNPWRWNLMLLHQFLCGLTLCSTSYTTAISGWQFCFVFGKSCSNSNSSGCEIFRTRPERPWCPPSLLYNEYRVFPRGKAPGTWRWPPTLSSAEVKKRVELFLFSPSGPSWPVLGWTLFRTSAQRLYWDLDQSSHTSAPYRLNFAYDRFLFYTFQFINNHPINRRS